MGTSPMVLTGRQSGKSILSRNQARQNGIQPMSVWFDEFETSVFNKKEEAGQFPFDPLVVAAQLHKSGRNGGEIFEYIRTFARANDVPIITEEGVEFAETIRKYFRNKLLIRTLKGEFISEYMQSLQECLDAKDNVFKNKHIPLLVKLPKFYDENTQTEEIFKNHVSLAEKGNSKICERFKFVGKIHRHSKNQNFYRFYFSNSKNNLLTFSIAKQDMGFNLWNYIADTAGHLTIEANVSKHPIQGYDFIMYHLGNKYEILN